MKKIITGCLFTIIGAFSNIALLISISFHINEMGSWSIPPGKIFSAMQNTGASILILPIILSTISLLLGLYFLSNNE